MQNQQSSHAKTSEAAAMARRARHPAERILSCISVLITVGILAFLALIVTQGITKPSDETAVADKLAEFLDVDVESAAFLVKAGDWIILLVVLLIYGRYWLALFNESNRAASEDLTCADLASDEPEKILKQYAEILGMKKLPMLYFSDHGEHVTIHDIVAYGKKYMVLSTLLNLESLSDERMPNLRFRLATKIGNIYMGYNSILFQVLTLPGRFLPGLRGLYIKSLIYSSDRMAMEILAKDPTVSLSADDVVRSVFLRDYYINTHPLIDVNQAIANRRAAFDKMGRLEKALLRLSSIEPPLMDRLNAIRDTSRHGMIV